MLKRHEVIRQHIRPPDIPDSYFAHFYSQEMPASVAVPFICCRFSADISTEGLLALGNESGVVFIANVEDADHSEELFKRAMFVDVGCVLDVDFLRARQSYLVVISGHSNVSLWDVDKGTDVLQFVGHEGSVRALTVSSDSPDIFATGARDGTICIWDQREKPRRGMKVQPTSIISSAHILRSSGLNTSSCKRRTSLRASEKPKGITSLAFLDANTLISASTSCRTGIQFRDLRYWGDNLPVRTLEYPSSTARRDFGVTSICLDRWRSSLFVSTTDSFIWEYAINSTINTPDVLRGVKRSSMSAFDMKLATSPISDHLSYGSGDQHALIWDLQEKRYFSNNPNSCRDKYYPYPKFLLGGHTSEVSVAQFSCSARYIVSMDDTIWRLWQFDGYHAEKEFGSRSIGFRQAEYYSFPLSQSSSTHLARLSVTPNDSPSNKRKMQMVSPFKSPFKSISVDRPINGERSPAKKISKLSSSPLSPLPNICNMEPQKQSARSTRRLDFSPEDVFLFENESVNMVEVTEKPKCAFHFKHPTQDLPDWIKERYKAKSENEQQHPSSASSSTQKALANIRDYFGPPSPSVSNCSRMVSQAERELLRSPRKLLLKQRLRESAERAQKVGKQATPRRSRAAPRRTPSTRSASTKTPASTKETTQEGVDSSVSSTPRLRKTIKDFFAKKS